MNHKRFITRGIMLALVLLLTACTASKTTPNPTSNLQSCPTAEPQSCPTTAAQASPALNAWRWGFAGLTNVIITFDPGDKCSMQVNNPVESNQLIYDIVINDQTYKNYVVALLTLDPGKTISDLKTYTEVDTPPTYSHLLKYEIFSQVSRTYLSSDITTTEGPFYFVCFVQGPDALKIIDYLGPLEVPVTAP